MAQARHFNLFGFIIGWIARLLYLGALTTLIPFGALLITSGIKNIPTQVRNVPITAVVLVGISIVVLFLYHRDFAHTLASMGWMTFLPGLGGLFFLFFSKDKIFALFEKLFVGFESIKPLLDAVQQSLPQVWIFVIGYVVLGFVLIHIAGRMDREHALTSQLRKIFGPRARIYKSR